MQSHAVLDAYRGHGGNFVDTADVYSEWKDGNNGGDSEKIIGAWMKARDNRDSMVIATKVAKFSRRPGLSAANILAAWELGIKLNNKAARVAEIAIFLYRTVIFYFSKIDSSRFNIFQTHI